jgi:hypothetical protein
VREDGDVHGSQILRVVDMEVAVDHGHWVVYRPHLVGTPGVIAPYLVTHELGVVSARLYFHAWKHLEFYSIRGSRVHAMRKFDAVNHRRQILAIRIAAFLKIMEVDDGRVPWIG